MSSFSSVNTVPTSSSASKEPFISRVLISSNILSNVACDSSTTLSASITASANSLITQSFLSPLSIFPNSSSYLIYYSSSTQTRNYYEPNIETYYYNQPLIGLKNRNTNKIQLVVALLQQ